MQVSLFSSARLTGFTVATYIYPWNEMMSVETMVGHGLHVLSDHLEGITGVHCKVNNTESINSPAFAGTACTHFILHNIIALHLGLHVTI